MARSGNLLLPLSPCEEVAAAALCLVTQVEGCLECFEFLNVVKHESRVDEKDGGI